MRRAFLVITIVISCLSCAKKEEKPDHLLSEEQMVAFLIDLHIAEARINDLSIRRDSSNILFEKAEDSLFLKHGIMNDSIYALSYEYYLNDVAGLDKIYSAVVDSLSLRERLSKMEKD